MLVALADLPRHRRARRPSLTRKRPRSSSATGGSDTPLTHAGLGDHCASQCCSDADALLATSAADLRRHHPR
jgi:hypothetical protein